MTLVKMPVKMSNTSLRTCSVIVSSDDVASSYTRMGVSFKMARAMAILCFSPPVQNTLQWTLRYCEEPVTTTELTFSFFFLSFQIKVIAEHLTVNPPLTWRTRHNHWATLFFVFAFQIIVPPTPTPSRTPYSEPSTNMKNLSQPLSYPFLCFFQIKVPPTPTPSRTPYREPPLTWRTCHNHWATLFFKK